MEILFPEKKGKKPAGQLLIFGDTEEETKILRLIGEGIRDGEEIMAKAEMSTEVFNQTITMLEIKGNVRGLGANKWTLV